MSESTYLPLAEAARQIGRSVDTLRRWIAAGRLRAVRLPDFGGSLYVSAEDLRLGEEKVQARTKQARRPRRSKQDLEAEEFLRAEGVIS